MKIAISLIVSASALFVLMIRNNKQKNKTSIDENINMGLFLVVVSSFFFPIIT